MKPIGAILYFGVAAVLLLIALWSALWIASSVDLAWMPCDGTYSLFSENWRCRQPYIAGLLCLFSLVLSICAIIGGLKVRRRR
jgi:hypothetical protein